jgi:hypothetical protein
MLKVLVGLIIAAMIALFGGRLPERKPVGLDARIDLRGHHHRSLDDQPGVPGY